MKEKLSICVLIVTYNRSKYLQKALEGILNQTQKVSGILIFNNDASDNTEERLIESGYVPRNDESIETKKLYQTSKNGVTFYYYHNDKNLGGAGGFSKGVQLISKLNYDYVWVMDDDVYPDPSCLEEILKQMNNQKTLVGIPNRTDYNFDDYPCVDFDFNDYRKFWIGLRKTRTCGPFDGDYLKVVDMPFEGPVIEMNLLRKVGCPDSSFFIEYDDSDYAQRLQVYSDIIFATNAKLHRQLAVKTDDNVIKRAEPYNWRNYYKIRNNIIFDKRYGKNWKVRQLSPILLFIHHIVISIRNHHFKNNAPIICKAFIDGIMKKTGKRINPNY